MRRLVPATLICAAALVFAPPAAAGTMRKAEPKPIVADAEMATVVFFRPGSAAFAYRYAIVDQDGRYLGEASANAYFTAVMPPGHYTFVSWGEGTPAMHATVEAGEVYYVEVGITMGAWTARARLFGMGPEREGWEDLPGQLAQCGRTELDLAEARSLVAERKEDIAVVIRKGESVWSDYDREDRFRRSLNASDGVTEPVSPR